MSLFSKKNYLDVEKRRVFNGAEIFFDCCSILNQARFSEHLSYYLFRRRIQFIFITKIRNRCVLSGCSSSVLSKLRVSRRVLNRRILTGSMPGFYRAVW